MANKNFQIYEPCEAQPNHRYPLSNLRHLHSGSPKLTYTTRPYFPDTCRHLIQLSNVCGPVQTFKILCGSYSGVRTVRRGLLIVSCTAYPQSPSHTYLFLLSIYLAHWKGISHLNYFGIDDNAICGLTVRKGMKHENQKKSYKHPRSI